ncbi:aminopyrimidine aminohydrolase [Kroppenstedtia guangzhouensis]|jgi:thiaminase (transcriptional activator TenA)|uniref:Aminopyrimidine aminohydrolase n=1 Tax=Kroppenstedtia guangzhouensis TaxID=1274356 RepID=A0ABQ1H1E1_9BACL|nr:thiaminase II [Kroppenstedtia guangzhouensis]GGA55417.1 aminopyrimidine aminohydrolase [Kroppenstedtia guangzhouensis]
MRFSEELRQSTRKSWEMSLNHPFVLGIVRGELPLETFRYYILQDIYYLKHYGKIHAMAAAQAEDFHVTSMLAEKAKLTAEAELTVHQEHAKILHITEEDLAQFKPAPTAYAYTSHLYRAALSGNLGETVAAMLPCYWLYADIGKAYQDAKPQQSIYRNWIQMYASDWFQTSTQEQIDLLDHLAEEASDKDREKMMEQFIIAKEYELAFWEMAYTNETWLSGKDALDRSSQA